MAGGSGNSKVPNINVGILGHIDSGKTALCRALATVASTASMDKNPQSQARGITLDLGFSSFRSSAPDHFKEKGYDEIQFCLVDCPGHASLIKTVIGGAQIIDVCCLVVDAIKGVQTQTAECIVVAELLVNQLIVIINKIDTVQGDDKEKKIDAMTIKLRKIFAKTKFGHDVPMARVAAHPNDGSPIGMDNLVNVIKSNIKIPERNTTGSFLFSFDHCFQLKGQGTVLTGTVLSGTVKPTQVVDIPGLGDAGSQKKVRSIQIFKQPAQEAHQGDRCALCIPALDAKEMERGIVIDGKEKIPLIDAAVVVCERISYFKSPVFTKAKFHISVGHQTVMATAHFFCPLPGKRSGEANGTGTSAPSASSAPSLAMNTGVLVGAKDLLWPKTFDIDRTYVHLPELFPSRTFVEYTNAGGELIRLAVGPKASNGLELYIGGIFQREVTSLTYRAGVLRDDQGPFGANDASASVVLCDRDRVMYQLQWLAHTRNVTGFDPPNDLEPLCYALLLFEKPVTCHMGSLLVGSKFDFDIKSPSCRIAFFGRILKSIPACEGPKAIKVVKMKQKTGLIDRADKHDKRIYICKDIFKPDTDIESFIGLKVIHQKSGTSGVIDCPFGKTGKIRVTFENELNINTDAKGHVRGKQEIVLYFKKFHFDAGNKKFSQ
eukprot:GEMP01008576.1.p1 GENE.GEMP01008576.1~~GEMP01008576.1.p1  ORF type:complete len:660 (+),score=114.32 GEMP01008576.1:32-2011(+)